ncbi:MAG: hypothetical protein VKJ64_11915 [Leptolyngbyaceae bacterium]|nr:hypothetical protein [Leptolyngbyaceae bacterium]
MHHSTYSDSEAVLVSSHLSYRATNPRLKESVGGQYVRSHRLTNAVYGGVGGRSHWRNVRAIALGEVGDRFP